MRTVQASVASDAVTALADLEDLPAEDRKNAAKATISTTGQNLHVTWTGEDPTATMGHTVIADGVPLVIEGARQVQFIRMIGIGGTATATVSVER